MKRPFRRFEVLCLAAALAGVAGCNPDHSVKPGAPVLTEVAIVEGGGATVTSIPSGEPACAAGTAAAGACDPAADTTCFLATAKNWCRCMATPAPTPPADTTTCTDGGVAGAAGGPAGGAGGGLGGLGGGLGGLGGGLGGASGAAGGASGAAGGASGAADAAAGASGADAGADAATPPAGMWDCDPFSPTAQVVFIFDRLIDTKPLGDADAQVAAASIMSGATPIPASTDYAPNGTPGQIIFPAFGDFRADGPSLLVSGAPALPGGAAVTVTLDKTKVLAKDGKTPFDGTNFGGGALTFSTVGFSASVAIPAAPASTDPCVPTPTIAPLDATGSITFNSPVDLTALMAAVTVKSGTTTTIPITLSTMDNLTFTITPATTDMKWPANAHLSIEVPATVADQAGDTIGGTGLSAAFTTGAQ